MTAELMQNSTSGRGDLPPALPRPTQLLLAGKTKVGTMLSSLRWSHAVLGEKQAWAFRALSLHADSGLAPAAFAALLGCDDQTAAQNLDQLDALHLVTVGDNRIHMDLLTEVASQQLALEHDPETVRAHATTRLLDWYHQLVRQVIDVVAPAVATPTDTSTHRAAGNAYSFDEALTTLNREGPGLAAVLRRTCGTHLAQATAILRTLRAQVTQCATAETWVETLGDLVLAARRVEDFAAEAETLLALARVHHQLGDNDWVHDCLYLALTIFRTRNDTVGAVETRRDHAEPRAVTHHCPSTRTDAFLGTYGT